MEETTFTTLTTLDSLSINVTEHPILSSHGEEEYDDVCEASDRWHHALCTVRR